VITSAPRPAGQAISGWCKQLEGAAASQPASSRIWSTEMLHALEMDVIDKAKERIEMNLK